MAEVHGGAERLESWVLLGHLIATSPSTSCSFLERFPSYIEAAGAGPEAWQALGLLRPSGVNDIFPRALGGDARGSPAAPGDLRAWARFQIERAARATIAILSLEDGRYPLWLTTIPDPPPILYVKGRPEVLSARAAAIVGARRASRYGLSVSRDLAGELARSGLAIVSGGARGIDSEAHRGALEAGGATVAVMGCGLDRVYPPENVRLFEAISEGGALVSEFAFGAPPRPVNFPLRNRVIAGLSVAVVVVEGRDGSGSLITADLAAANGREVLAVPGPVTSALSAGPLRLIAEGAAVARDAGDVLAALPSWAAEGLAPARGRRGRADRPADPAQAGLWDAIDDPEGLTADQLAGATGRRAPEVLAALTELELEGAVERLPGGRFARKR